MAHMAKSNWTVRMADQTHQSSDTSISNLRNEHIGRVLMRSSRIFERLSLKRLTESGFDDLRMVHLSFLRNLDLEGSRLVDIADNSNMTKQAAGQLAQELEAKGYITKAPSPHDGRAKIVAFTGPGLKLVDALPKVLADTEAEIAESIGEKTFKQIKLGLSLLITQYED